MNLLLLTSHAIAEYDDLRMFADMGVNVFSIGGAYDEVPFEGKRPPIDNAPRFPEFEALNHRWRAELTEKYGDPESYIDWVKARLHTEIIDWADVIVVHHFPDRWIGAQWHDIRHKRVIWRTCGQSDPDLERFMATYRRQGLQIVRYSPAERRYFEPLGAWAGEDAVIRFGKYPDDYGPWIADGTAQFPAGSFGYPEEHGHAVGPYIANVTQNMVERGDATGLSFYLAATKGLPARPAGPGSEQLPGGIGALPWDEMREYLRRARAYIYTGTAPASYTLGLIEAMMSGVPVVSIGPGAWAGPDDLFDGHLIVQRTGVIYATGDYDPDDPVWVRVVLRHLLESTTDLAGVSENTRRTAIEFFGIETIAAQWREFLA